jgi:uncharacterized protein YggU (UPF0235/DUF167 family)
VVRLIVRVRPGASRAGVRREGGVLVVRVHAPPVDGRATAAALEAVADALGVRPRAVTLVTGATSRTKVVDVEGDETVLAGRLAALPDG